MLGRIYADELSDKPIDLLAVSGDGDWLAAASSRGSDLLLWNTEYAADVRTRRSGCGTGATGSIR